MRNSDEKFEVKIPTNTDSDTDSVNPESSTSVPPSSPPRHIKKDKKKKKKMTTAICTVGSLQPFDSTRDDFEMWCGTFESFAGQWLGQQTRQAAQRRLFTTDDIISFKDTVQVALAQEAAEKSTVLIRGHQPRPSAQTSTEQVHKTSHPRYQHKAPSSGKGFGKPNNSNRTSPKNLDQQNQTTAGNNQNNQNSKPSLPCSGCGSAQHPRSKGPHHYSKCFKCGIVGHIAPACRKGKMSGNNHLSLETSDLQPQQREIK
ncbi:unnamed protein product [Orchesella dallaii]|uniref:CCHC-type domain-containing protein n=1 Tax=Orchesella dallaii TaxID=48710 RepID=A0ABP1RXY5_9HEXA